MKVIKGLWRTFKIILWSKHLATAFLQLNSLKVPFGRKNNSSIMIVIVRLALRPGVQRETDHLQVPKDAAGSAAVKVLPRSLRYASVRTFPEEALPGIRIRSALTSSRPWPPGPLTPSARRTFAISSHFWRWKGWFVAGSLLFVDSGLFVIRRNVYCANGSQKKRWDWCWLHTSSRTF